MKTCVDLEALLCYNTQRNLKDAGIAQSVEHFTRNEGVVCSSHITSSILENTLASLTASYFYFRHIISTPVPMFFEGRNACGHHNEVCACRSAEKDDGS